MVILENLFWIVSLLYKLRKLGKTLVSLLMVTASTFIYTGTATATDYVWARVEYDATQYEGSPRRDSLAAAIKDMEESTCYRLNGFKCETIISGPIQWTAWQHWLIPTRTTWSRDWHNGTISTDVEAGYIHVYYECPLSWTGTMIDEKPTYRCSRETPPRVDCDTCSNRPNEPRSNVGNPINVIAQTKIQTEVDYVNFSGSLSYIRTYQSDTGQWADNWSAYLIDWNASSSSMLPQACFLDPGRPQSYCYPYTSLPKPYNLELRRGNSPSIKFDSGFDLKPPSDIDDRIVARYAPDGSAQGWEVSNPKNHTSEFYRKDGRLESITDRNGMVTRLYYSDSLTFQEIAPRAGLLIRIEDQFKHTLNLQYNSLGQVKKLIDPDGHEISYTYDIEGMVSSVTYPDGKTRKYMYNEPEHFTNGQFYRALTGIVDENSDRFATFKYKNQAAYSTIHGKGVDQYTITDGSNVRYVTDPLGRTSTYNLTSFSVPSATKKIFQISQPSAAGTGLVYANWEYDAQLNVKSKRDFNGSITKYTYDLTRNLETSRVEASGTPESRTISTAWHPEFRLPLKIAEPKRLTTFIYDNQGRILSQTEQATTDLSGAQGFSPTFVGQPRSQTWTYNQYGQILTTTGRELMLSTQ